MRDRRMTASSRRFNKEIKDDLFQEVTSTSKLFREVSKSFGLGPETLRNWLRKYLDASGGTEVDLTRTERPILAMRNLQ